MKIHIGCGSTLLDGFVNMDNSPTLRLSKLPRSVLWLFGRLSLLNQDQLGFAAFLRSRKKDIIYGDCLRLPFADNSVEFAYCSHLLGWYLGKNQINQFLRELYRVLRPGGGARISFYDLDRILEDYQQHRDTVRLMDRLPLGSAEFGFRARLKFLLNKNMQNGLPLNVETFSRYLEENGFCEIRSLAAGETTMDAKWVEALDLYQRASDSIYMESRKGDR
jgi:predicted SAM-dependent methyltransferase